MPDPKKIGLPRYFVQEFLRLNALRLLSCLEWHLHVSGQSKAGMGLQLGVIEGPDSEWLGLRIPRNQVRRPAIIRPRLFSSQNPEGYPHFETP
jgi:hypothetical protein